MNYLTGRYGVGNRKACRCIKLERSVYFYKSRMDPLSPIGIKKPGMIGVMEPVLGVENGHPYGVKNERIWQRRQERISGRAERPWDFFQMALRAPCNRRCGAADRPLPRRVIGCSERPGPIR